jgi:dTMP kinase
VNKGLFITFEGVEGSGKSTQIALLYKKLIDFNYPVVITKEPGGTDIGREIRHILLNPDYKEMDAKAEILLYAADRSQDVSEIIKPALAEGKLVLSDRYVDSNIAYQGYGRGLDINFVNLINEWVIENCKPDLTFILDIDVEKGLDRARGILPGDRLEQELIEFHQRVRDAYLKMAGETDRFIVLNAEKDQNLLHREILEIVKGIIKKGEIK